MSLLLKNNLLGKDQYDMLSTMDRKSLETELVKCLENACLVPNNCAVISELIAHIIDR